MVKIESRQHIKGSILEGEFFQRVGTVAIEDRKIKKFKRKKECGTCHS